MFWLVTGDGFPDAFRKIGDTGLWAFLARQLDHCPFEGFTFYDVIFPGFLFVMGTAIVPSLDAAIAREGKSAVLTRVLRRTLILLLLGAFMHGGMKSFPSPGLLFGVLQRLAYSYGIVCLLYMFLRPRAQAAVFVGVLVAYWIWLCFVPLPTTGVVTLTRQDNWCRYAESYLPPYVDTAEGVISGIPAVMSCLLGVFAGRWLGRADVHGARKAWVLIAAGVAMLVLGYAWGLHFPIVKRIWSSTYVSVAGGYCLLLLGALNYLVDVKKVPTTWALPFTWIGMNPLAIYITLNIVDFNALGARLAGGPLAGAFGNADALVIAIAGAALGVAFAWYLNHKKVYIRL